MTCWRKHWSSWGGSRQAIVDLGKGGAASREAGQVRQAIRRAFVRSVFDRLPPALYNEPGSETTLARVQEGLQQLAQTAPGLNLRASDDTVALDIKKLGYRRGGLAGGPEGRPVNGHNRFE